MKSRRMIIAAIVVIAALVAGVLWWTGRTETTENSDQSGQVLLTRAVERRTLRDEMTIRGVLERARESTITAAVDGRITTLWVDDGDTVEEGDPLLAVSGRTSVAVNADTAFFRPLDIGSRGSDVTQLEQILSDAGFSPGPIDDLYTNETRGALALWQSQYGYPGGGPEPGETITLTLNQSAAGYTVGAQNSASVTIDPTRDPSRVSIDPSSDGAVSGGGGDTPTGSAFGWAALAQANQINLLPPAATVSEGQPIVYTVVSSVPAPAGGFTVNIVYTGTALAGNDYAPTATTVTIAEGATSTSFTVSSVDDETVEVDPQLTVTIEADGVTTSAADLGPTTTATTTIIDDDVPELNIAVSPASVIEGQTATATITASSAPINAISVNIGTGILAPTGSATPGTDFDALPSVVTLPAGALTVTFPVVTQTDDTTENGEDAVIGITAGSGYSVGASDNAILAITDNGLGTIPAISISATTLSVNEGGTIVFTLQADTTLPDDIDINLEYTGSVSSGTDYDSPDDSFVTLSAGTQTATVTVATLDDLVTEPTETLQVRVLPGAGYTISSPASEAVDVIDNDLPEISLVGGGIVYEGSTAGVTLISDQPLTRDITVALSIGGSATLNVDYEAPNTVATLPAGSTSSSVIFPTLNDKVLESDETVSVSMGGSAFFTPGPQTTAQFTIVDREEDAGPSLTITSSAATVPEGASVTFTVTASRPSSKEVPIRLVLSGTAENSVDYVIGEQDWVIPPNQNQLIIQVPIRQNEAIEGDESLIVSLSNIGGYRVAMPSSASVTIVDEDVPELTLRGGNIVLGEGDEATFVIEADQPVAEDTSVSYSFAGTAISGQDFEALTGTVTMLRGRRTAEVPITLISDDVQFQPSDMIAGTWPARIGSVVVDDGQTVVPGSPLIETTVNDVAIKIIAAPSDFAELAVGQRAEVEIEASDTTFGGSITQLDESPTINDAGVENYEGRVEVDGDLPQVDGANASVKILIDEAVDAIVVPVQAVLQGTDGDEVRVVDPTGEVTRVQVTTGLGEDSWLEIRSGLNDGDIVLIEVQS